MTIFKNYTYRWWQIGLFKLALLAIGIAIGAYWQEVLLPYLAVVLAVGVVLGAYIALVSFRQ
ncbi:MAG TPA: hypothetical protein VJ837_03965 [Candidatus Paceibacterota bacterium]|nr:hypothetical protein [Candidatus Paceibacterota bacterium]